MDRRSVEKRLQVSRLARLGKVESQRLMAIGATRLCCFTFDWRSLDASQMLLAFATVCSRSSSVQSAQIVGIKEDFDPLPQ